MFCSECGTHVQDGEHFCSNCGAALQTPGGVMQQQPEASGGSHSLASGRSQRSTKPQDPYKDQIQQVRLQIRQLKLDLKQITTNMSQTRARYNQTSAFLPGIIKKGSKFMEDISLREAQPQKQQLQQQIAALEQQLLGLQQQQMVWKQQSLN